MEHSVENVAWSNLPIALVTHKSEVSKARFEGNACMLATSSVKLNLSKDQEELLLWHEMLGHYEIAETQKLFVGKGIENQPAVIAKLTGVATCTVPLCRSCLRVKGKRTSLQSSIGSLNVDHNDVIKNKHFLPGYFVSIHQQEHRVKGRLPNSRGKEDPEKMHSGGTVFVGHVSGVIKIHQQVSLGASDTMRSEELHEPWASRHGVTIKSYRGDNGVFKSELFKDELKQRH